MHNIKHAGRPFCGRSDRAQSRRSSVEAGVGIQYCAAAALPYSCVLGCHRDGYGMGNPERQRETAIPWADSVKH